MDLGQCSEEHADEIQQFKWKQTEFGNENSLYPVAVGASLLIYFWLPGAMFTLLSRLNHLICLLLLATRRTPSRNPSKAVGTHQALRLPECHLPSEWGSLSYCRASQGQAKAFIFPSTKTGQKDLIITNSVLLTIPCVWQHGGKGFTSIDLWILHKHMIEGANTLLALQRRLLRVRQKAIWLWF